MTSINEEIIEEVVEEKEEIEEKVEEVEEEISLNRQWHIRIWERNEPLAKDVPVANLKYSQTDEELSIENILAPRWGASIQRMFIAGVGFNKEDGSPVALNPVEDPEHWIRNLHLAPKVTGRLYATEAVGSYEA